MLNRNKISMLIYLLIIMITFLTSFLFPQNIDILFSKFQDPPSEFGPLPFFWWTGEKLSADRIGDVLDKLKSAGFAGVNINYTHTVAGYTYLGNPPLFSDEWWLFWEKVVEECKKRGMTIGFDDYLVTHGSPKLATVGSKIYREVPGISGLLLRQKSRIISGGEEFSLIELDKENIIDVIAYEMTENKIIPKKSISLFSLKNSVKKVWIAPKGQWYISIIYTELQPYGAMNPLYAQKVIEYYFEKFEKHSKGELGKSANYFFQDELTFGGSMPFWSSDFMEKFKRDKNYDIKEYLTALFTDIGPKTVKIRLDYYDIVTKYMEEAYFKPIFEWCDSRKVIYGHDQIARADVIEGVQYYGDYFSTLKWYHAPGTDRMPELLRGKTVASIAQLYNRPRTWFEAYHSEGWGVIPQNITKWDYEALIYGYNLIAYHSCYYTTLGGWWEWAPGDITFRQPYWDYFSGHYKEVKRLCYLLSQGKHKCDVAILFPTSTVQGDMKGSNPGVTAQESKKLLSTGEELFKKYSIDFDFIDDFTIQNSNIENKTINISGGSYKVLILPAVKYIRTKTLEKILQFYRNGGIVIALSALPEAGDRVGGNDEILNNSIKEIFGKNYLEVNNLKIDSLLNRNDFSGIGYYLKSDFYSEKIARIISKSIHRDFSSNKANIFVMHRQIKDINIYALYNPLSDTIKAKLNFSVDRKNVEEWISGTGERRKITSYTKYKGNTELNTIFMPNEFKLLVFSNSDNALQDIEKNNELSGLQTLVLDSMWEIQVEPLLNNKWGDFISPGSDVMILPVTKEFRYKEQFNKTDSAQYFSQNYKDNNWETAISSYGPVFWLLGPLNENNKLLLENKIITSELINYNEKYNILNKEYLWIPQCYSKRWGIQNDPVLTNQTGYAIHGPIGYVPREIIHIKSESENEIWYAGTSIQCENAQKTRIAIGTAAAFSLYLNGEEVLSKNEAKPQKNVDPWGLSLYTYPTKTTAVNLNRGTNNILLKIRTAGSYSRVFIGLSNNMVDLPETRLEDDPSGNANYVPDSFVKSEQYDKTSKFQFDVHPDKKPESLWYRFETPPGMKSIKITAHGSVNLWINNKPVPLSEQTDTISIPVKYENSKVYFAEFQNPYKAKASAAIRIEAKAGYYGGAALPEPVKYTFSFGEGSTGDWANMGMNSYSGAVSYSKKVILTKSKSNEKVYLNLGEVACAAKVKINNQFAGYLYKKPYTLDISSFLIEGENTIQITVANTLANHYRLGMPGGKRYIKNGQLKSGLFGPVKIEYMKSSD